MGGLPSAARALEELRRLLGVLSDQDGDASRSPQAEIPSLVDEVPETGQLVELRVEGQPRVVSGGVGIAAHRIVQEALTNVLKHAGGAPAHVVLRWAEAAVELEILDHGLRHEGVARAALRTILDAHDDLELVAAVEDGLRAVEQAGRLHPDVVLLDIRMPNLDGLEAARQILASASNRTRVIMLTTFDLDEYVYDAHTGGAYPQLASWPNSRRASSKC